MSYLMMMCIWWVLTIKIICYSLLIHDCLLCAGEEEGGVNPLFAFVLQKHRLNISLSSLGLMWKVTEVVVGMEWREREREGGRRGEVERMCE
jgi:hypothetical protein